MLLARRQGLLRRRPARAARRRPRAARRSRIPPSTSRTASSRAERRRRPDGRVDLRARTAARTSRRRCDSSKRSTPTPRRVTPAGRLARAVRRPERRADRDATCTRRSASRARSDSSRRNARCSSASSAAASSTSGARSIRTTTGSSRGGRRGATCAQRNIGWRLDYVLASAGARRARRHVPGPEGRRHERPRAGHGHLRRHAPRHPSTQHRQPAEYLYGSSSLASSTASFATCGTTPSPTSGPRPIPAPRSSSCCCAIWPPSCAGSASTDVGLDEHGYVMATIPATTPKGRRARRSASSRTWTRRRRCSGAGVTPIVHRAYDGRDLVLPDDPTAVLRLSENPELAEQIGHDIVTASGTTLLGADNKAGVAEIVTAAEYLIAHPEIRARTDSDRLHAGRRDRPRHRSTSTSRDSARAARTRWTAAAAAKSRARASRRTR